MSQSNDGGDGPTKNIPKNLQEQARNIGVQAVGPGGEKVSLKDLIAAKQKRQGEASKRIKNLLNPK